MFKSIVFLLITFLLSYADSFVMKTGQTIEYKVGDNGTYHALTGLERSYNRDDAHGIVTDNVTGLQWQDYYPDGTIYHANWEAAKLYCTELELDGSSWRLPSRQELKTIVDYSYSKPAINTTFFHVTASGTYWSSTSYMMTSLVNAWRTNFNDGGDYINNKDDYHFVRCVRGVQ